MNQSLIEKVRKGEAAVEYNVGLHTLEMLRQILLKCFYWKHEGRVNEYFGYARYYYIDSNNECEHSGYLPKRMEAIPLKDFFEDEKYPEFVTDNSSPDKVGTENKVISQNERHTRVLEILDKLILTTKTGELRELLTEMNILLSTPISSNVREEVEALAAIKYRLSTDIEDMNGDTAKYNGYQIGLRKAFIAGYNATLPVPQQPNEKAQQEGKVTADLSNKVYAAIIGLCEELESEKMYRGNGHHLAQKLTAMVIQSLPPVKEEKKWTDEDSLFTIWNKARECTHFKQFVESLQNKKP